MAASASRWLMEIAEDFLMQADANSFSWKASNVRLIQITFEVLAELENSGTQSFTVEIKYIRVAFPLAYTP